MALNVLVFEAILELVIVLSVTFRQFNASLGSVFELAAPSIGKHRARLKRSDAVMQF